jgi:hypothetical protein
VSIPITAGLKRDYFDKGYLVLRQALEQDTIKSLDRMIEELIDRAISGRFKMKWLDKERALPRPRVQLDGLIDCHSRIYEPYCGRWLLDEVLPLAESLLGGRASCKSFGMLFHGEETRLEPKDGGWHRDGGGMSKSPYTTEALAQDALRSCSFHAPLKPEDNFHQLVPGTHVSPSEREEGDPSHPQIALQELVTIVLNPGDLLFRHAKILHRGFPQARRERRTFVGDFWKR